MSFFDNMGGIVSADFLLQSEIDFFAVFGDECTIGLKDNSEWKSLKTKKEGINITSTAEQTDAGLLFSIKGSIILKKESDFLNWLRLSPYILLRYKTVDGIYRIIGTQAYPLSVLLDVLTPSKASGFYGFQLTLSGKQDISPPILKI